MIIDTMTFAEVKKEILADCIESEIFYKAVKRIQSQENKYKRAVMQHNTFHVFTPFSFKSKRGNEFYIQPYTKGKHSYKKEGVMFLCVVFFRRGNDLCTAMIHDGCESLLYMYSHVFQRYNERYDKSNLKDEIGVVRYALRFLAHNSQLYALPYPSKKYGEDSIIANTNGGFLLGHLTDGVMLFKTFVAEDMIYDTQVELNKASRETKEELIKEEYEDFIRTKRAIRAMAA